MFRGIAAKCIGLGLGLAVALTTAAPAQAGSLSAEELGRLVHGETVSRTQTIDSGEKRYVGGVTYTVLDSSPEELEAIFDDVASWRHVLPRTRSAKRVGVQDGDVLIELHQGTSVFQTSYTIRVRKDPATRTVRFWLDASRPHGIADAWGFFRVERVETPSGDPPRALLTYGVLVDLGDGLVRALFEERVRSAILGVPYLVRGHLARLHAREPVKVSMTRELPAPP